ncbi:cyclic nucleotide-binding domain-containing protein, partial [Vibrio fortis]
MSDTLLPNILQFIDKFDPFDKVPKDALRELASQIQISYVGKGEVIDLCSNKGEKALYIVRTGALEQRKSDGVLRAKLGPEDLFGFTFLGQQQDSSEIYQAIAIENSLIYSVPHSALKTLFTKHPESAEHFASQAQVRLKSALDVVWSNKEKGLFIRRVGDV